MASSDELRKFQKVRNFGVAAHIDAGKTTLTERILYYTGASYKIGEVHEGNTQMDYMPEERERGITITAAVTHCDWKKHHLHLIDTPGHVDFTMEVERSMRVLDGVILVIDAVKGVEPQTETVWRQAERYQVPRMVFVNKMDRPGADFERAVHTLETRLGAHPMVVAIPVWTEAVTGILDLLDGTWVTFHGERNSEVRREPVPESLADVFEQARERLVEGLADFDDDIAEQFLAGEVVSAERLRVVLRRETIATRVQPVLGGAALRDFGVQPVLDAIIDFLPNPLDVNDVVGEDPKTKEPVTIELDSRGKTVALAFKVQMIQGRRHVYLKLYRGRLSAGQAVWNATQSVMERIGRVYSVRADRRENLDHASAGDIVIVAGLKRCTTGDTLCDPRHRVVLEPIRPYEPVVGLAVEPMRSSEEEKVFDALSKMVEEDPTLALVEDPDSGQRILRGMGELHLTVVLDRIRREYGVNVRTGRPRVVYRECLTSEAEGEALVDRTTDKGARFRARVRVRVKPTELEKPVQVMGDLERIVVLPPEAHLTPNQVDWLRETVGQESQTGPIEGYPLVGCEVHIAEVELFGMESTEVALREAAARATRAALRNAEAHLLAPIMFLQVEVPADMVGSVLGDLQARGGVILGMNTGPTTTQIDAECPMERLFGYANDLRSATQGRGTFTLQFSRLDKV